MSANVIDARGLTKRYGGKTVVDRLTLSVPRGAIYAFLGDHPPAPDSIRKTHEHLVIIEHDRVCL